MESPKEEVRDGGTRSGDRLNAVKGGFGDAYRYSITYKRPQMPQNVVILGGIPGLSPPRAKRAADLGRLLDRLRCPADSHRDRD